MPADDIEKKNKDKYKQTIFRQKIPFQHFPESRIDYKQVCKWVSQLINTFSKLLDWKCYKNIWIIYIMN